MNIIFLDVDGVLNSYPYHMRMEKECNDEFNDINDYNLNMLAKIYHTCNAKIVLSSTWRQFDDINNLDVYSMYQHLVNSLNSYDMQIMSKTPIIKLHRPLEIVTWINEQSNIKDMRFVSLDDDFPRFYYERYGIGECLVRTKYFCDKESEGGLQEDHVDKAIRILMGN